MRTLKDLSNVYSAEYDVEGVNDPFLQVLILKFLKHFAEEEEIREDFASLLATITVNLSGNRSIKNQASASNSVNCILFECVRIILNIDVVKTLKNNAINILAGFLALTDTNSKFVSLRTLLEVSKQHEKAVNKHLSIILDCLQQKDLSIRRMTLQILKHVSNSQNIALITRHLFNDMLSCAPEALQETTPIVCGIIESNAQTVDWYFKSMLRVLVIAGNFVDEENVNAVINTVSNTPEIQAYAVYKLYFALCENQEQQGLAKCVFWLVGEHPSILIEGIDAVNNESLEKIPEESIVNLIDNVLESGDSTSGTKNMALNCLVKLYDNFKKEETRNRVDEILSDRKGEEDVETQNRAVEYEMLVKKDWIDVREEIFQAMPAPDMALFAVSEKPLGEVRIQEIKQCKSIFVKKREAKPLQPHDEDDETEKEQNSENEEENVDFEQNNDKEENLLDLVGSEEPEKKEQQVQNDLLDLDMGEDNKQRKESNDLLSMGFNDPTPSDNKKEDGNLGTPSQNGNSAQNNPMDDLLGLDIGEPVNNSSPLSGNFNKGGNDGGDLLGMDLGGNGMNQVGGQSPNQNFGADAMGDLLSMGNEGNFSRQEQAQSQGGDDDLFGGLGADIQPTKSLGTSPNLPKSQTQPQPDLLGFGDDLLSAPQNAPQNKVEEDSDEDFGDFEGENKEDDTKKNDFEAIGFEDPNVKLKIVANKEDSKTRTGIAFELYNKTQNQIEGIKLSFAVKKYLKMELQPDDGSVLQPGTQNCVTQVKFCFI